MTPEWFMVSTAAATLASALVAGVFLTFSDFVMRSLALADPLAGAQSMQMINREVFRSLFMVLLLGLVPFSVGLAGYAVALLSGPAVIWMVAAAVVYVAGVFAVTMFGNVPMNNRLDGLSLQDEATTAYWARYARDWTRWNHLRTAASAVTSLFYLMAVIRL